MIDPAKKICPAKLGSNGQEKLNFSRLTRARES